MTFIDGVLVENDIFSTNFMCDLEKCKGACCTFPGEYGAPLLDEEVEIIERLVPIVEKYLPQKAKETIKKYGVVEGKFGDYTTVCINKKDCVFVYYDGDIALCALEKAYLQGESNFRKPISCHLFPIRVRRTGYDYLYYQRIDECNPGVKKGNDIQMRLFDCLAEAIIRKYGLNWFNKVKDFVKSNK